MRSAWTNGVRLFRFAILLNVQASNVKCSEAKRTSVVCRLPSVVCRPSSAVRRLPSVVCRPSSAVRRLPSVVCRPSSAVRRLPSVV
ncbi:MAG TPA: hypothetical protein ENJ53_05525, partial [Phaeodactylibacter sp.]|nr:hypothetical protein [Phaeodactylibacter sp.]